MSELRARLRTQVQGEIRSAAMALFAEQGFDGTTIIQIAEAADVSPRSFFRYFPTKEDVVLDEPADYADQLREILEQRPADESAWEALRETLRTRTCRWQQDPANTQLVLSLWAESETLQARQKFTVSSWREALVAETQRRLGRRDRYARLRAAAVVATVFACLDVAMDEWQQPTGNHDASLDSLFDQALAAARP